jgi:hypothetical protein
MNGTSPILVSRAPAGWGVLMQRNVGSGMGSAGELVLIGDVGGEKVPWR